MIDYTPPDSAIYQPISEQPIHLAQDSNEEHGLIGQLPPITFNAPTDEDLRGYAQEVINSFSDGFQWSDIGCMIRLCAEFLTDFPDLSYEGRKNAVVSVLDYVIDFTDTPYLPDQFFDPLFKAMVDPFVELIIPKDLGDLQPSEVVKGKPSDVMVEEYSAKLLEPFEDGFQWSDLGTIIGYSIQFSRQFPDLSYEDKCSLASRVIDNIIDKTDTPYLPDFFSDPLFKAAAHPVVRILMESFKEEKRYFGPVSEREHEDEVVADFQEVIADNQEDESNDSLGIDDEEVSSDTLDVEDVADNQEEQTGEMDDLQDEDADFRTFEEEGSVVSVMMDALEANFEQEEE